MSHAATSHRMQDYVEDFRSLVERATLSLQALSEEASAQPRAPGKWSPREVIGHLIDSASNNHQRFVRAQFQDDLVFAGYDQDAWVRVQQYQQASWTELITLWRTFNLHLARVMAATPEVKRLQPHHRHNLNDIAFHAVPREQPATLDYFMRDYVAHLKHHLGQVLGSEWDAPSVTDHSPAKGSPR
jgi:hypothetical protein